MEFKMWPKIARLNRTVLITEKIDGTNGQITIVPEYDVSAKNEPFIIASTEDRVMFAGSRRRWVTPEKDNYGFARWVKEHAGELWDLPNGIHNGEWWGHKIQRAYGLTERRFSLFNTMLYTEIDIPSFLYTVPLIYQGSFDTRVINMAVAELKENGSKAAPGYMNPEGIVIYHTKGNVGFKVMCENDDIPKGGQ